MLWPTRPIGCLVSVGTGLEGAIQLEADQKGLVENILKVGAPKLSFRKAVAEYCVHSLTSCERVHRKVMDELGSRGLVGRYFRFNVDQGMSQIGLEEWKQIQSMITFTRSYMDHGDRREARKKVTNLLLNPRLTR